MSRALLSSRTFRPWGLVLATCAVYLTARGSWVGAGLVAFTWLAYVLTARVSTCRVGTPRGGLCGNRVSGLLGTCGSHAGDKWRTRPAVAWDGSFRMPRLWWPRPGGTPSAGGGGGGAPPPAPPRPAPAGPGDVRRRLMDTVGVFGLVVAVVTVIADVMGG